MGGCQFGPKVPNGLLLSLPFGETGDQRGLSSTDTRPEVSHEVSVVGRCRRKGGYPALSDGSDLCVVNPTTEGRVRLRGALRPTKKPYVGVRHVDIHHGCLEEESLDLPRAYEEGRRGLETDIRVWNRGRKKLFWETTDSFG